VGGSGTSDPSGTPYPPEPERADDDQHAGSGALEAGTATLTAC
jgi:hypothetical protein